MTMFLRVRNRDFIEAATRRFRAELAEVVAAHEQAGHDPANVLGDPAGFAARAVQASAPLPTPWDQLVGPFTDSEGVRARLGITRQAVAAKAGRRRLLRVITADGLHLYPVWQFDRTGVRPGLVDILALFPEERVDGWTLAGWLRTQDPDLGEPPLDVLIRGEHGRVLAAARTAAGQLGA